MTEFVQLIVSPSQVQLASAACKVAVQEKGLAPQIENGLWDLIQFFDAVVENPGAWPVTGRMATSLKVRSRRMKGEAQPPRKRRRTRHQVRIDKAKARRKDRKATVAAFNAERVANEQALAAGQRKEGAGSEPSKRSLLRRLSG